MEGSPKNTIKKV